MYEKQYDGWGDEIEDIEVYDDRLYVRQLETDNLIDKVALETRRKERELEKQKKEEFALFYENMQKSLEIMLKSGVLKFRSWGDDFVVILNDKKVYQGEDVLLHHHEAPKKKESYGYDSYVDNNDNWLYYANEKRWSPNGL